MNWLSVIQKVKGEKKRFPCQIHKWEKESKANNNDKTCEKKVRPTTTTKKNWSRSSFSTSIEWWMHTHLVGHYGTGLCGQLLSIAFCMPIFFSFIVVIILFTVFILFFFRFGHLSPLLKPFFFSFLFFHSSSFIHPLLPVEWSNNNYWSSSLNWIDAEWMYVKWREKKMFKPKQHTTITSASSSEVIFWPWLISFHSVSLFCGQWTITKIVILYRKKIWIQHYIIIIIQYRPLMHAA